MSQPPPPRKSGAFCPHRYPDCTNVCPTLSQWFTVVLMEPLRLYALLTTGCDTGHPRSRFRGTCFHGAGFKNIWNVAYYILRVHGVPYA